MKHQVCHRAFSSTYHLEHSPNLSKCIFIDFERSAAGSNSPPTKTQSVKDTTGTTTPFTPSNGQKRFNPFMKDIPNAESNTAQPTNINNNRNSSSTLTKAKNYSNEQSENENDRIVSGNDEQNIQLHSDENKNIIASLTSSQLNHDESNTTSERDFADIHQQLHEQQQQILNEATLPEWVTVGESVLIRPYNTSGVISFIGPTHFQVSYTFMLNIPMYI